MKQANPPDPVFQRAERAWYFYDETWAGEYGPYDTEEECRQALESYCKNVL